MRSIHLSSPPINKSFIPKKQIVTAKMANLNFAYSSAPLRTIEEIQFGLFSPEEIKNMSVVHIEYPETMVSSDP